MSAHDFQAKFASVMESILHSAVAETTKLFEAMVDELKADMSIIKKDNDDLKAKCSQFESAQKDAIARNNSSKKRHSAVQCDIISFCNKVAEQSQPSVPDQRSHRETFYPLQEHDYDVRANGRTVVRHESVSRQQDFLHAEAESPRAFQSESEGASIKTRELPQELPDLGMYNNLQGGQNQEVRPLRDGPPTVVGCHGPPPKSAQVVNTSQAPSLQPRKRCTSVTLQDATLLVEAMSSSVERRVFSSQQGMAVKPVCVASVSALQRGRALSDLQILPHSSESPKELAAAAAESSQESMTVTKSSEPESQVRASSAATSAAVQPQGSPALETSAPSIKEKRVSHKIIIRPRLAVSLESCDRATQRPSLGSAAATKVNTAKNTGKVQTATAPDVTHGALTRSSVKMPFYSSNKSLPVPELTIIRELPSGAQQPPIIKVVFPAQQTVKIIPKSDKPGERADRLPPQEVKLSLESPTPPDVVPTVSQVQKEYSQSCFSVNSLAGLKAPAAWQIKPFAVVRLTRLPFLISKEESVLISRLSLSAGWDSGSAQSQDTGSSRPASESPPVITNNSGPSALTGSPCAKLTQSEATSDTGQPTEQKTSSKDQEKDSPSCTEPGSSKRRRSQKNSSKAQPRNRLIPHLEVRSTSCQHAETQTVTPKKDQQDYKIKLDLPEIAQAVSSLRKNRDSFIQRRKSALSHRVTESASKDKYPDEDISCSKQGTAIQTTAPCASPSSLVRTGTTRNAKPGLRLPDTNVTPRSLRRTGASPDTAKPERAKSVIIYKRYDSSIIFCKPKTRAAESASVVHGMCTAVQPASPVEDGKKRSNSSGGRQEDGRNANLKSTGAKKPRIMQAEATPTRNLRVVNAKKLAKKAKANMRKRKAPHQLLQNCAKATWLEANPPSSGAAKKVRSSGVWIPPVGDATARLSLKTETTSPKAPDRGAVDPPRVSVHPVPVRAAPVVSPLQPLSLIGSRLLKNQCGVCGQVLGSSSALESHVGLHTRRPFSCRLCGKSFTDSKALKRHGRVHRNGKIHVCQKCGKAFVYKFSLSKHLQMVHRRIKPFVCQICSKSFFTKLDVESHIRIHTGEKPFHCNLCERKFIRRVDLNVHLRWHNGEKRHWCPYCKKGFLDFNNLKRHKYIHTGEKPHPCTHCPKQFTQSAHLKKHVKNVHKITGGS